MLDRKSIEIWRVALSDASSHGASYSASQIEAWRAMLSPEEQRRADAFHGEGHRQDYVVAHVALRSVLGQCIGLSANEVRFAEGSFAGDGVPGNAIGRMKPALIGGRLDRAIEGAFALDIRFNLSHTRGIALIGITVGRELGVDVEFQRPMEDLDAMAHSVMSAEELKGWQEIPIADRKQAFYRVWTRKEAYLKAIGLGLYRSLHEVTVPVVPLELDTMEPVRDGGIEGRWQVMDVALDGLFAAAVCCEGEGPVTLAMRELDLKTVR